MYELASQGRGREGQAIRDLYQSRELGQIYPDCAMMGSLAVSDLAEQTWQDLQSHLFSQVGKSVPPSGGGGVRLAILDTQPGALWERRQPGTSPHGWFVAHLGRRLLCRDGHPGTGDSCLAGVTTRLALPLKSFDRSDPDKTEEDIIEGGYFGRVTDLTNAIRLELGEARGSAERLVLNLALGWEGTAEELGEDVSAMPVPVQALHRILEEAACRGVIVIAAAGNRSSQEDSSGLLLPAAWVRHSVDLTDCDGILGAISGEEGASSAAASDFPRPLVYAVGGVDSASRPLSNAREQGMPELAAFADHAVVETFTPGRPTKTYTGSSVAAAVASAAVATVWSEHPGLPPRKVMEILYDSGCELSRTADVAANPALGPSAASPQIASLNPLGFAAESSYLEDRQGCNAPPCVHRICLRRALCRARQEVSGDPGCFAAEWACPGSEPPDLKIVPDADRTIDASRFVETELAQAKPGCKAPWTHVRAAPGVSLSPQLLSALCSAESSKSAMDDPWTGPQPQDPPCPNCTLEPQGTGPDGFSGLPGVGYYNLYIEIDEDWPEWLALSNPVLLFENACPPLSIDPGPSPLGAGDKVTVSNIRAECVDKADRIVLEFITDDGRVENPVLVAR